MTDGFTPRVCLSIAGLDPSGGAGVVADIKTFSAFQCFAAAAVTSITFQNTTGVFGAVHQSGDTVGRQINAVLDDYEVGGVKTGMLPTREIIEAAAGILKERGVGNLIVDPVVRSTSGFDLIDNAALAALIENLFPLATLVTPNLLEAERIAGIRIETDEDLREAARIILDMGAPGVLIKGGHTRAPAGLEPRHAIDHLFSRGHAVTFEALYIETTSTHGTGCTLAAAICANLALGFGLDESIRSAKAFVTNAISTAPRLGHGNSPINIETILRV